MREIWIADAETDPFEHGAEILPFIWGCYNGSEYHEFTDTREFVDFFADKECIVYAHNGGKFDWHFLLEWLEPFNPVMVIAGRLAKFRIGSAEFRDSYNILPAPLKSFQKDEVDYSIFQRAFRHIPANWQIIRDYLRSDCVNLYQFVKAFIDRYGLNLTFAGAAMKVWQKIENIKAPQTSADFYQIFEPFYYGGRVQAFELGEIRRPFKVYDMRSAYPRAMKDTHPYGDTYEESTTLPARDEEIQRTFITLECASKGAFPYRQDDGSLEFPADGRIREFSITGWEYLAARDLGDIDQSATIRRVLSLPLTIRFDGYIDHFFSEKTRAKNTGDKAGYQFAKFFLNGLYGKFAANPEKYSEYMIVPPENIWGGMQKGYDFSAPLGPWALMSRDLPDERQRYYNLAVGASITGHVRANLYRAIRGAKGVIYCDTDCIVCEEPGDIDLDPVKLGAWELEAECDYGGVAGKKLYAFHKIDDTWKVASKGARLTPDELMRIAAGEMVEYKSVAPTFSVHNGKRYIKRRIRRKDVAKAKKRA